MSNITEWGLRRINEHYRKEWPRHFADIYPEGISAEDIFAYTYAVLHDPVYRYDYRVDLLRELPRLPLYRDFDQWAQMGRELLDLHLGFAAAEPYPLERQDGDGGGPGRALLRADREGGRIILDSQTTLAGRAGRCLALPAGQPVGAGVGTGSVQGAPAPGCYDCRPV